ncbi:NAD(P)H-quinone oxidoreductase [Dyella japonica]|uniref:NAD(P)H-quinone oxidoreductase n=2 Tax=Dyella japonica TaxID=231455 RepID=A0A075K7N4_9GAMM|nr:NAD(P)H-quinone oxidoreductase [Dyella japonica]AIF48133.1 NAD(P)H-quinone oxidoreductase [Dyella japonica A8]
MHAVTFQEPGVPEVLKLSVEPVPIPGKGEALIRVQAAGVNRPDVLQRQGRYPIQAHATPVLGLEVAGEIVAMGSASEEFEVGDRVCALIPAGGYAEYAVAPIPQMLRWPEGYGAELAACLPETLFTVYANLFQMGRLKSGETVLIHGGSGGIGTTAIQLAKAFGARVIATARGADACRACVELGADRAIDYSIEDFVAAVKEETHGHGVNVILDVVGADYFQRNLDCLATDGRLILLGFLGGEIVTYFNLVEVLARRLVITGSAMRPRTIAEKGEIARQLRAKVWPVLDRGLCRPVIAKTFPLAEAASAHRMMESGGYTGRIVLVVKDTHS